jgi:hypothetical protein
MVAQQTKLAGASLPPGSTATQRAQLDHALKESFVSGFRAAMIVAAVLAVVSALLAAWLIEGKPPQAKKEEQAA